MTLSQTELDAMREQSDYKLTGLMATPIGQIAARSILSLRPYLELHLIQQSRIVDALEKFILPSSEITESTPPFLKDVGTPYHYRTKGDAKTPYFYYTTMQEALTVNALQKTIAIEHWNGVSWEPC